MSSAPDRFDELLAWYVNGTLNAQDREWMEQHMAAHPEARAEVDWYRSLQQRVQDNAPAVPETIGLGKVMTLIRGDQPTLVERINAFFASFALKPALVLAGVAVIAVQSGMLFSYINGADHDEAEIRSLRATRVEEGPMLKVSFAPDAKEADIRLLLVSVQGQLAGGPGQLGDYYIRVPAGKESQSAEALKSNPIVQAVALAPGVPPRE